MAGLGPAAEEVTVTLVDKLLEAVVPVLMTGGAVLDVVMAAVEMAVGTVSDIL